MKPLTLLAALALAATALAIAPTAQATDAVQPCPTAVGGCCGIQPAFAPCCSALSCPTPAPRCASASVHTTDYLAYIGPSAGAETRSDCAVSACTGSSSCQASQCDPNGSCCTLDGTQSACTSVQPPAPCSPVLATPAASAVAMALPLPHVSYAVHADCSLTVWETYDCPNGFWDTQSHLREGPVDAYLDTCTPQCACYPQDVAAASAAAPPGIQPPPQCLTATQCCFAPCPYPPSQCRQAELDQQDVLALVFGPLPPMGMVYTGPTFGAQLNSDCTVDAWEHNSYGCEGNLLPLAPSQEHEVVGRLEVTADSCTVGFICACMPASSASATGAALQPPVKVEVVQCVRAPCPPRVTCTEAWTHEAGFTVHRETSCHVWLIQDPIPCENPQHVDTTIALVTVRRATCGPGVQE